MNHTTQKDITYHKISAIVPHGLRNKKEEQVLEICRKYNTRFRDPEFAPNSKSLVGNPPDSDNQLDPNAYQWGSAEDIFGQGGYSVFNGVDPSDIQQGYLGDCYLLCAISSLAERPSLVYRLFDTVEPNKYGVYSVWLNINGMWREIILDDLFPVVPGPQQTIEIAFSRTTDDELWPLLLEKAYAKAYGSYTRISAGDPLYALRDLTGAPYRNIVLEGKSHSELDQYWTELVAAERRGWICVCGTYNAATFEEHLPNGLVSGHAYSLLDAQEVTDSQGHHCRILLIRNPHGKTEWNGDWSDSSWKWTPQLRQRFGVKIEDDGLFWMPWEDFTQAFQTVGFCKVEQNFMYNAIKIQQDEWLNKSIIRFDVHATGKHTISVDQLESRSFPPEHPYAFSYCRVTLGQLTDGGIRYVDCKMSSERNIFCSEDLQAGRYVALIEMYWSSADACEFVVSSYGVGPVGFRKVAYNVPLFNKAEYYIWKDFCRSQYSSQFQQTGSVQVGQGVRLDTYQVSSQRFGLTLIKYQNTDPRKSVEMSFVVSNCEGYDVVSEYNSGSDISMKISPSSHEVLILKVDPRSNKSSCGYQPTDIEIHDYDIPDDYNLLKRLAKVRTKTPIIDIAGGSKPPKAIPPKHHPHEEQEEQQYHKPQPQRQPPQYRPIQF